MAWFDEARWDVARLGKDRFSVAGAEWLGMARQGWVWSGKLRNSQADGDRSGSDQEPAEAKNRNLELKDERRFHARDSRQTMVPAG